MILSAIIKQNSFINIVDKEGTTDNNMSVPAINPVLTSSGNQPSKVTTGPAASNVTPLGLTVPQKMPVMSPQISSPNKPPLNINHSPGPLSLVHENKISGTQTQASLVKPSDKPKDLSPPKPTSNGVESSTKASPSQVLAGQGCANAANKDEKSAEQLISNHATNDATKNETPGAETPEETKISQPQNSSDDVQSVSQSDSGSISEAKASSDATLHTPESGTEVKSIKSDGKGTSGPNKRKREQKTEEKKGDEPVPEKKPQRIRSQVLPYQSPFPELTTFIHKSLKEKDTTHKSSDEKLIVFYKSEFLAVRNAENGFYLCQTLQNVYRTSHRIRIRWLSQDKESNTIYTPDFYDFTDFECILTTVALEKIDKNKYKLPELELERTQNILKRALDVEKGVSEKPCVTEEHPDGIDLSLYKDESQLQKPKKRKSAMPSKKSPKQPKKSEKIESQKEGEAGGDETGEGETAAEEPKKKKRSKSGAKSAKAKPKAAKKGKSQSSGGREKSTKGADELKVSPPNEKARVVAKVLRKVEMTPASSKKSKSKGKTAKSSSKKSEKKNTKSEKPTTSNRSTERRGSAGTSRKKTGKK